MQNLISNIVSLTPLKRLIATTIQNALRKYIQDIELEELGLLGGDVVLENLELRRDVVQELMGISTAFDLSRGFIKELRIHIPWTRLATRPIEIKFHTIEVIVIPTKRGPGTTEEKKKRDEAAFKAKAVAEAKAAAADAKAVSPDEGAPLGDDVDSSPSWIQMLIKRAIANISVSAEDLVLKLDDGTVVLSATLKSFRCYSADPDLGWEQRWLDLFGPYQLVHKLIEAKQLTVCVDRTAPDSSRKRTTVGFERPLLDRMSFSIRMQVPLEPRPAFDKLGRHNGSNGGASDGFTSHDIAAYGSGDLSVGFDDGWGFDAASKSRTDTGDAEGELSPVFKLPVPSNCGRALEGRIRRPRRPFGGAGGSTPFDDAAELWEPIAGWKKPSVTIVDPLACKYARAASSGDAKRGSGAPSTAPSGLKMSHPRDLDDGATKVAPDEIPIPTIVADVHCADLRFSVSERQLVMVRQLLSLLPSKDLSSAAEVPKDVAPRTPPRPKASKNIPTVDIVATEKKHAVATLPQPPMAVSAPEESKGWFSRIWGGAVKVQAPPKIGATVAEAAALVVVTEDEQVKKAHTLLVVSVSVPAISLDLLRHSPGGSSGGKHDGRGPLEDFDEADGYVSDLTDTEQETFMTVPVFGLGNVRVEGLRPAKNKASPGKRPSSVSTPAAVLFLSGDNLSRSPVSFLRFEMKTCTLDCQMLSGGGLSFMDVKMQVCAMSLLPTGPLAAEIRDCSTSSYPTSSCALVGFGNAASEASPLGRSAAQILDNYAVLICSDKPLAATTEKSPSRPRSAPATGAALELRLVTLNAHDTPQSDSAANSSPRQGHPRNSERQRAGFDEADPAGGSSSAPAPTGFSLDVGLGRGEVAWSERVVTHLHGFLLEGLAEINVDGTRNSGEMGRETKGAAAAHFTHAAPVDAGRGAQPKQRVCHYQVSCQGFAATFNQDGPAKLEDHTATVLRLDEAELTYSLTDRLPSGDIGGRHSIDRVTRATAEVFIIRCGVVSMQRRRGPTIPNKKTQVSPFFEGVPGFDVSLPYQGSGIFLIRKCTLEGDLEMGSQQQVAPVSSKRARHSKSAPIARVLLSGSVQLTCDEFACAASAANALSIGSFIKAVLDVVDLGAPVTMRPETVSDMKGDSVFVHVRGAEVSGTSQTACSLRGARGTSVSSRARIDSAHLRYIHKDNTSVLRGHILKTGYFTTGATESKEQQQHHQHHQQEQFVRAEMRIESPSDRFLAFFLQNTGYRLASYNADSETQAQPQSQLPTLRLDFHSGHAEADLQRVTQSAKTLGAVVSKLLSTVFGPSKSPATALAQLPPVSNKRQPASGFGVAEYCVVPTVRTSPWRVWMTPFLFATSPEVSFTNSVERSSSSAAPMCIDAVVSLKGGSVAMAVAPFGRLSNEHHLVVAMSSLAGTVAIPCAISSATASVAACHQFPPQVGVRTVIALHCDRIDFDLDSIKVAAVARCLKVWTAAPPQHSAEAAGITGRPERRTEGETTPASGTLVTDSPAGALVNAPPVNTEPGPHVQKRLTFDEVFNRPIAVDDGDDASENTAHKRKILWPIHVEVTIASVAASLHLNHIDDGTHPTEVMRFCGHGLECSSSLNFVGGDGTGLFRQRGKSASLPSRPSPLSPFELAFESAPTLQVTTYRFAISKLGACDEVWLVRPAQTLIGQLLLLAFGMTDPLNAGSSLRYFAPGKSGLAAVITSFLGQGDGGKDARKLNVALQSCRSGNRLHAATASGSSGGSGAKAVAGPSKAEATATAAPWPWLCAMPRSADAGTSSSWFEAQLQQETALSLGSLAPQPQRRARVLLRLRQSDVLLHLPSFASIARLLEALSIPAPPRCTKEEAATSRADAMDMAAHESPRDAHTSVFLPMVLLEVQPVRVLLVYGRRQGQGWSAIDALQWSFTCSATATTASQADDPFRVEGAVGPMDVATVVWLRKKKGAKHDDSTRRSEKSLVLQGPAASFFSANGDCYVMADESLFGDPFKFTLLVDELLLDTDTAHFRMSLEASPVVITCSPGQYQAVLRLAETAAATALSLAATGNARHLRSERSANKTPALFKDKGGALAAAPNADSSDGDEDDEDTEDTGNDECSNKGGASESGSEAARRSSGMSLDAGGEPVASTVIVAFSISAPKVELTILAPKVVRAIEAPDSADTFRDCPLLELRTASIAVHGITPGKTTLTIEDISVFCFPEKNAPARSGPLDPGVALFGLASEPSVDDDDDDAVSVGVREPFERIGSRGEVEEPLLMVDFTTYDGRYGLADVLAQLRPIFLFASPLVIDSILQFASGDAASPAPIPSAEPLPYPLPRGHELAPAARDDAKGRSLLGDVSIKLLSRHVQAIISLEGDGSVPGPAVIITLRHVFLNKQRQRNLAASIELPSDADDLEADAEADEGLSSDSSDASPSKDRAVTARDESFGSDSSADTTRGVQASVQAKAQADDEIVVNAVGFSVAVRSDHRVYRCSRPHAPAKLRRIFTVSLKDCLLLPCSITAVVGGKVTNELCASAFIDLHIETVDTMEFRVSSEKLQLFFAILWALCDVLVGKVASNTQRQTASSEDDSSVGTNAGTSTTPASEPTAIHPALIPPPVQSVSTRRVQLSVPLDTFTCAVGVEPMAGRGGKQSVLPGCMRVWAGPGPLAASQSHDPHAAAEHDHALHTWVEPLQRTNHCNHGTHMTSPKTSHGSSAHASAPGEAHIFSTLAKAECVAAREWFAGPHWRYHSPRSVTRLEMKQLAAPKALLSHLSGPGVAHLCLQRHDSASGRWVTAALCSVPIFPLPDAPSAQSQHVTKKQAGVGRKGFKQSPQSASPSSQTFMKPVATSPLHPGDGWAQWVDCFGKWCEENAQRPRLRFLVPATPPAAEWRLLWACSDVTDGPARGGKTGGRHTYHGESDAKVLHRKVPARLRAVPTMLLHCLGSASLEDAPFLSLTWRVRTFSMAWESAKACIVERGRPEAIATVDMRALHFNVELPGATWSRLLLPTIFLKARTSVDMIDLARLTSASLLERADLSFWFRGIARGPSYFSSTNMSFGLGPRPELHVSPRQLLALRTLLAELGSMFDPPPAPVPISVGVQQHDDVRASQAGPCEASDARYCVENETNEPLWFGQVATSECLCLGPSSAVGYSWRSLPHALSCDEVDLLGAGLSFRFALDSLATSLASERGSEPAAWSEPVRVDLDVEKTICVHVVRDQKLKVDGKRFSRGLHVPLVVPLLVTVLRCGLKTTITLRGKYAVRSSLPYPVDCRWILASSAAAAATVAAAARGALSAGRGSAEAAARVTTGIMAAAADPNAGHFVASAAPSPLPALGPLHGSPLRCVFVLAPADSDSTLDATVSGAARESAITPHLQRGSAEEEGALDQTAVIDLGSLKREVRPPSQLGSDSPFLFIQTRVAGRKGLSPGPWSSPVIISARNGAVLHDATARSLPFADGSEKGVVREAAEAAEEAMESACLRRRSLGALLMETAEGKGQVEGEGKGDGKGKRRQFAVVALRPLRRAGDGDVSWSLIDIGAPAVVRNDMHSEPLVLVLTRLAPHAEDAPAVRRFGQNSRRNPMLESALMVDTGAAHHENSAAPPPSPAARAMELARDRLAAKMAAVQNKPKEATRAHGHSAGPDSMTRGASEARADIIGAPCDSFGDAFGIAGISGSDGRIVVLVPPLSAIAVNLDPTINYSAEVFSAASLIPNHAHALSLQPSARPLVRLFNVHLLSLLLALAPPLVETVDGASSLFPYGTPEFMLQVSALVVAPAVAALPQGAPLAAGSSFSSAGKGSPAGLDNRAGVATFLAAAETLGPQGVGGQSPLVSGGVLVRLGPRTVIANRMLNATLFVHVSAVRINDENRSQSVDGVEHGNIALHANNTPMDPFVVMVPPGESRSLPALNEDDLLAAAFGNDPARLTLRFGTALAVRSDGQVSLVSNVGAVRCSTGCLGGAAVSSDVPQMGLEVTVGWSPRYAYSELGSRSHLVEPRTPLATSLTGPKMQPPPRRQTAVHDLHVSSCAPPTLVPIFHALDAGRNVVLPLAVTVLATKDAQFGKAPTTPTSLGTSAAESDGAKALLEYGPATVVAGEVTTGRPKLAELKAGRRLVPIALVSGGAPPVVLEVSPRMVVLNPTAQPMRLDLLLDKEDASDVDHYRFRDSPLWLEVPPCLQNDAAAIARASHALLGLTLVSRDAGSEGSVSGASRASTGVLDGPTTSRWFNRWRCSSDQAESEERLKAQIKRRAAAESCFGTVAAFRFVVRLDGLAYPAMLAQPQLPSPVPQFMIQRDNRPIIEVTPLLLNANGGGSVSGTSGIQLPAARLSPSRVVVSSYPVLAAFGSGCAPTLSTAAEHRIVAASLFAAPGLDSSLRVLLRLEPQPRLVVKNLLSGGARLEFAVDDDATFALPLDARGGSAEYMWSPRRSSKSGEALAADGTMDHPQESVDDDDESIFHPSKAHNHTLRLRRAGGCWSKALVLAEGAQFVDLGEGEDDPVMVRAFDRAGTLVVVVSSFNASSASGSEDPLLLGVEALKRYAFRPGHFDISLVLPAITIHLHDDSRPQISGATGSGQPRGLLWPEVLQLHASGVLLRMEERPPEPHWSPSTQRFAFAEESAHVKYLTTVSCVAQELQVDTCVAGCDLPIALAFLQPQEHGPPLPCLHLELDTVTVHKRPECYVPVGPTAPLVGFFSLESPRLAADAVLPYVAAARVEMRRKAVIAAEQPMLSAVAGLAALFLDAATAPISEPVAAPQSQSLSKSVAHQAVSRDVVAWVAAALSTKVFLGSASISELSAAVTLRCFVSRVFVGLDRTPLLFQPVSLRRVCAPAAQITSEVTSNYAVDALLRSPQVVGSLQLLGSPTILLGAVGRGLRDLVAMPLEALPLGPVATGRACLRGGSSFLRHVSGGALSSVSSFSSSVSRNLTSLQQRSAESADLSRDFASDKDADVEDPASGMSESASRLSSDDHAGSGSRVVRALGTVGKAVLLAPLVGAMGLVGRTTATLSAAVSGGGGTEALRQSLRPLAPAGGTPLLTPLDTSLWIRAKLLPFEPRLTLLLRAEVRVALLASAPASGSDADAKEVKTEAKVAMVLLVTHTRFFLERRGALALQAPLACVSLRAATKEGGVTIDIEAMVAVTRPAEPHGRQRLVVEGLSTRQQATLAAAVDKRRSPGRGQPVERI